MYQILKNYISLFKIYISFSLWWSFSLNPFSLFGGLFPLSPSRDPLFSLSLPNNLLKQRLKKTIFFSNKNKTDFFLDFVLPLSRKTNYLLK